MSVLVLEFTALLLQDSPDKVVVSVAPQGINEEISVLKFEGKALDCDSADEPLLFFKDGNFSLEFFEELACLVLTGVLKDEFEERDRELSRLFLPFEEFPRFPDESFLPLKDIQLI